MVGDIIHSNTKHGLIAQNKVELRAIEKGYMISRPITECSRYDAIIDFGTHLERVQIKYAGSKHTESSGVCVVDFRKKSINGIMRKTYSADEVDAILVYLPDIDEICYFPISFIKGKGRLSIRYAKSKNNQKSGIILADNYIW